MAKAKDTASVLAFEKTGTVRWLFLHTTGQ